jgi:hypothetical protein
MVLIENQPHFSNPLCKSLSIGVYSFFKIKGIPCKLISATRKLGKEGKKMSYVEKKNQAVIECFKLISDVDKQRIQQLSRMHDIADAVLQAYVYHTK